MENELRARRDALEFLWQKGLSGKDLLMQHTDLIDAYLSHCFRNIPEAQEDMTLVALGGYGRKELFPYSDIDLMLLYDPNVEQHVGDVAEKIFYPLWDAGLEVGHAVRSPEGCLHHGENDFYFQVAMLDSRPVTGSEDLFFKTKELFKKSFVEGKRRDFFKNMNEHLEQRHQQYGKHIYQLEPNVKECHGGLRDVQAILWTAQVVFGLNGLSNLEDAGLLSQAERGIFEDAWNHLIKIRNRLHYISKRKNDRLFFEHQEEMAEAFGYKTKKELLGVEQFMQRVYAHLKTVAVTADHFFEHVDEVLNLGPASASEKQLEPGISIRHGRIHLGKTDPLLKKPELLMHIFAQGAKLGIPVHYRTRKQVTQHLHLIDDKTRSSKSFSKSFFEVLLSNETPLATLTEMLDTGLLTKYIPEFRKVSSLAQHDVYHTYTVDRHLLQTVAELKYIKNDEQEIFSTISSPHVLYLAALIHDIGKGQGGDHSVIGASLAKKIGARLGLSTEQVDDLVFLVENHLFLINTALRRDLEDEVFIIRCARKVDRPERLNMLYLLSIADSKATGKEVWSEWKAALLLDLYLKITHLLDQSDIKDPDRKQGVKWMKNRIAKMLGDKSKIDIDDLPEDYILSSSPETVIKHLQLSEELENKNAVLVAEEKKGFWSLLIVARDQTGLLSKICGTLALHNLNVLSAQIFTLPNSIAVDNLNVSPIHDHEFHEQDWQGVEQDLNLSLAQRLGLAHRLDNKSNFLWPVSVKTGVKPPSKVVIDNKTSDFYTVIEVYTEDQPGKLYDITRSLAEFGINIYNAKIGTKADQAVDVFYVLNSDGEKIEEENFQEEIRSALLHAIKEN